jgi:hypothetical protein
MDTANRHIAVNVRAVLKKAARPRHGTNKSAFDFWPQNELVGKFHG